jgi:hypothetical protein
MKLPEQFWKQQKGGAGRLQGGVELGLMSTTADRELALQYSGAGDGKLATILEAESGRVDCGGRLGFLSQYPGEEEYLLGPFACLEVMGRPRAELTKHGQVTRPVHPTSPLQRSLERRVTSDSRVVTLMTRTPSGGGGKSAN